MTTAVLGGGSSTEVPEEDNSSTENTATSEAANTSVSPEGGEGNSSSSLDFIPEEFKEAPWAQKYKTPEDFFNGIDNMNKMLGKKEIIEGIKAPGEDATDEDWQNFYKQIGAPEEQSAYELAIELENPLFDVDQSAEGFKELAHKNGLTQKQAQGLFKDYAELTNGRLKELQEKNQVDPVKVTQDLWGKESEQNLAMAKRAATHLGIGDDLDKAGISTNPLVLQLAKALGETLKEGTVKDGGDSTGKSSEELLAEAKKLQASPEYRSDQKVYDRVDQIYQQVYGRK